MKTTMAVWAVLLGSLCAAACASSTPGDGDGAGAGGGASQGGEAGEAGGAGGLGGEGTGGPMPETLASVCADVCTMVVAINDELGCEPITSCQSDCQLGAYPGCDAEYLALRKCWAENVALEVCSCSPGAPLTCSICATEQYAFQECGGGF